MADDPWSGLDRQTERWTVLSWGDLTDHQEDSKLSPQEKNCAVKDLVWRLVHSLPYSQGDAARQGFCYLTVT